MSNENEDSIEKKIEQIKREMTEELYEGSLVLEFKGEITFGHSGILQKHLEEGWVLKYCTVKSDPYITKFLLTRQFGI